MFLSQAGVGRPVLLPGEDKRHREAGNSRRKLATPGCVI